MRTKGWLEDFSGWFSFKDWRMLIYDLSRFFGTSLYISYLLLC
jgi:hypothetical protein